MRESEKIRREWQEKQAVLDSLLDPHTFHARQLRLEIYQLIDEYYEVELGGQR